MFQWHMVSVTVHIKYHNREPMEPLWLSTISSLLVSDGLFEYFRNPEIYTHVPRVGLTGSSWHSYSNLNNHSSKLQYSEQKRISQDAQRHKERIGGWATKAGDRIRFHSCQPRTGTWGYGGNSLTKPGTVKCWEKTRQSLGVFFYREPQRTCIFTLQLCSSVAWSTGLVGCFAERKWIRSFTLSSGSGLVTMGFAKRLSLFLSCSGEM